MVFTQDELTQGEYVVASMRTHMKAIWAAQATFVVTIVVFVVAAVLLRNQSKWYLLILAVIALIVLVVWVIRPVLRWHSTHYVVTNKRIITRQGIVSTSGRDIPLFRVNDVSSEQGPLDRILGCGTLVVSDASEQRGLALHDVPQVKRLQVELTQLLLDLHDGSDDDGTAFQQR